MKPDDKEFLNEMATHLNGTIKELVVEEKEVADKIGAMRVAELKEFWNHELSDDEERFFRTSLDYWDKKLIYVWARIKRVRQTRLQVGHTIMKKAVLINHDKVDL
ncbi:MAG: hypothetical protein PHQ03_03985 [Methylococcales bacterium]|nr:hypothetical protein [Methylococcales bacterium]